MDKPYLQDKLRCECCLTSDTNYFSEKWRLKDCIVLECSNCGFVFVPWYYRKSISYTDYKNEDVLRQIRSGNDWLKVQRHYLRFALIRKFIKKGKLFDLGSGWGHFMQAGRELGYDVYGIEVSTNPYIYASQDLKLPVDHIDFFKLEKPDASFDIITMWDVLEHIDDANACLEKCARLLKRGGYLVVQVPQVDSFIAKQLQEKWTMAGLDHVNYFSPKTIRTVLERQGFEVKKIKSSLELKLLLMYVILPWVKRKKAKSAVTVTAAERQEYFNKKASRPRWQLKIIMRLHNVLYNTLSFFKIGEEMIVVARKK